VIELRDQLVDALLRLLPALVGVQQLLLELADAPLLPLRVGPQRRALALQALVARDQRLDRVLQSLQVVRLVSTRVPIRNGDDPPSMERCYRSRSPPVKSDARRRDQTYA
jgi:hypothetical protein